MCRMINDGKSGECSFYNMYKRAVVQNGLYGEMCVGGKRTRESNLFRKGFDGLEDVPGLCTRRRVDIFGSLDAILL